MANKIILVWVDKIRKRLKHYGINQADKYDVVFRFVKPILDYGENEEKRITKEYNN